MFVFVQLGKPGLSYNELELVEGDISDDDSNEQKNGPLDPRAGNVSVEIPRIKFNPKDVSKLLNKYVTEVDCSRKCLIEITKLIKWYNRLGEGILPYKPKDLKLNSQVLKRKKKKHLSKMVKEGVKRLEMVDSKIKKNSREVNDHKSLKELDKMGEIIVEHGKIGKSVWKVRKFDASSALKENISLNGSWTVSEEVKNDNTSEETACVKSDGKPPLLIPAQSSVSSENSTPSLKSLISSNLSSKKSSLTKTISPKSKIDDKSISKNTKKSISPYVKNKSPNIFKMSPNNKSFLEHNKKFANVEKQFVSSPTTPDNNTKNNKKEGKSNTFGEQNIVSVEEFNENSYTVKNILESNRSFDDLVMSKIERHSTKIDTNTSLNESWSVCNDEKLTLKKQKSQRSNITNELTNKNDTPNSKFSLAKNNSPNTSVNASFSVSTQDDDFLSKKVKPVKRSSLSSTNTPEKNSKSPKSPKSPTPEQRVLRRRTIIISKKKTEEQKDVTPKRKAKDVTATKLLQKRRKTIAGEEITMSMLKPDEISNKALEKVVS